MDIGLGFNLYAGGKFSRKRRAGDDADPEDEPEPQPQPDAQPDEGPENE